METLYVIEYIELSSGRKVRYLNGTSFKSTEEAEDELRKIKKEDQKRNKLGHNVDRGYFKIVSINLKTK